MSTEIVKYAFIAGEISPTLFGRTDLTKYDLAVAEGYNFFVDYRGGLSTRPGFEFGDWIKSPEHPVRITGFNFSPDLSNNYLLVFGHNYIRFVQDNGYVLEDALAIEGIANGVGATVTITGHGLTNGKWVKLSGVVGMTEVNNRTYLVSGATANTFTLSDVVTGALVDSTAYGTWASGGDCRAVYEVASPYAGSDLAGLTFYQYRDLLRITSADFPIRNLVRIGHTNWTLGLESISPYTEGPAITGHTSSAAGSANAVFAVTKILSDGSESAIGNFYSVSGVVNYPATEGSVSVTWSPENDAKEYYVYRSIVAVTETMTPGTELGYLGRTTSTKFTDPNIIPDFTRAPPINFDPFAPGAITDISITAVGSGYSTFGTTVSITDPDGTGFEGEAIVNASGEVVNVIIKNGGTGYTAPVVSFSGGGTGATATATARELTGTYPAVSCIYQQRQIYAASSNDPITIWGSQIKRFSNFSTSPLVLDTDAYEVNLDTPAIAPIKHLLPTRGGLLAMTQENIWLLNGGSPTSPVTPTQALAEPQSYNGISDLRPLRIDSDLLFAEGKGFAVRMLSYNEISKIYSSDDRSILSNHLFGPGRTISSWAYQESPFKVVWSVRSDGALLAFTIVKSEEVYAWTPCGTKGRFTDVSVVRENESDRVYVITERYINGSWVKFFERQSLRQFVNVEDAWCVDAGLSLGATYPPAQIVLTVADGVYTATADATVFTGALNKILRAGNGIFRVSSVTSAYVVVLEVYEAPTNFVPETGDSITFPIPELEWTLDTPTTTLSGLWHLEGESVSILADGNVFPQQTVVNGTVTLAEPVTRAIVGLPFTCRAKTLPVVVPNAGIEGRRKRVLGLATRVDKTRGLCYGRSLDQLYSMRERTTEDMGRPTRLINGLRYQPISSSWDENGQTYFVSSDPLPATLLSIVLDIEVGDEPD